MYAKISPIGRHHHLSDYSSFVISQTTNLITPSLKPLKITFQRNLQIQNWPSGSRDIRPTRAETLRKVPLGWILSALGDLLRVSKLLCITVWCPLSHKFNEQTGANVLNKFQSPMTIIQAARGPRTSRLDQGRFRHIG